jgi:hypothetical protein
MPATPIPAGSTLFIAKNDEEDPESNLVVSLCSPTEDNMDYQFIELGNSFGAETIQHFMWLVRGAAAFHNLPVEFADGVEVDET